MLNCPFCNTDYTETGLRDGRCRGCGSVIAWEEDDPVDPDLMRRVRDSLANVPPAAVPPDVAAPKAEVAAREADPQQANDSDTHMDSPRDATTMPSMAYVTSVWEPATQTSHSPLMTLKVDDDGTTADSPLVIQSRSVAQPGEATFEPADYELLDVIGEGGVGVVYSARQASIDREVAVKMLRTETANAQETDAFLSEAVVTGDLDHPNIVPIHDLGRASSGAVFYAMKRVQGTPWDQALPKNSLAENLDILMKVADAVAFAHARGIVHRDLKPENVMLGDFGEVLVMDWGIAVATESFSKIGRCNTSQAMGGTPAYMAPEMVMGPFEMIGPHSDVYLLGAILYEIVAGHPPHTGADVMSCVMAAARNEIRGVDRRHELLDIAMQAMSTDIAERQPSVLEFQRAIRTYQSHSESILLSTRAAADLAAARESGAYDSYARAVFAFEEALALWEKNETARQGLTAARIEYADRALQQGDFDLGLSLLDADVPQYAELRKRLADGQHERDARQSRLKNVRRLVALLLVAIFAGGTFLLVIINDARQTAEVERLSAEKAKREAEVARDGFKAAVKREQAAVEDQKIANVQAVNAKLRAESERDRADNEKRRAERLQAVAEEESYFAEIGLAGEKVASNAFGDARDILDRQRDSLRARMRHWEWGRMEYLCFGDPFAEHMLRSTVTQLAFPIETMAVSPDGQRALLGGSDGFVELRALPGGEKLGEWHHGGTLTSLAISSDGRYAATAGADDSGGIAKIWDLKQEARDEPVQTLGPHGTIVLGVSFAPTTAGPQILTCSDNKTMKLWNHRMGEAVHTFAGHLDRVWSARFSPDGSRFVSASEDGSARIWSTAQGTEIKRFVGHRGPVYCATFSPDGRHVASAGYGLRVLVWSADTDQEGSLGVLDQVAKAIRREPIPPPKYRAFEAHTASIRALGFSASGDLLVSSSNDNTICVWDVSSERDVPEAADPSVDPSVEAEETISVLRKQAPGSELLLTLRGHGGWVTSCSLLADNQTVVSGSLDQALRIWNLLDYEEQRVFRGSQRPILAAAMSPDMKSVVTGLDDGTSRIWDSATGKATKILKEGHDYLTSTAILFPDGERLLTAAGDDTAGVWSVSRGTEEFVLQGTGRRGMASLSGDGSLVLTGASQKRARIWEVASGRMRLELDPHEEVFRALQARRPELPEAEIRKPLPETSALAFSPDGKIALTGDAAGRCVLWSTDSGERLATLRGHSQSISAAVFLTPTVPPNASSTDLVTSGTDGIVHQWNLTTHEYHRDLALKHRYPVMSLDVSPDGKYCVTASAASSEAGGLWLWDLETAEQIGHMSILNRTVHTVTFNPKTGKDDAVVLATATDNLGDRALLRWDLATNKLAFHENASVQSGSLWMAKYTADREQLLTVGGKGARLWNAKTGQQAKSFRPQAAITAVCFSPSSEQVVTASQDGTAKIWSVETGKATHNLSGTHNKQITSVSYSADGSTIMTTGKDGLVAFWDAVSGTLLPDRKPLQFEGIVNIAVFAPHARQVLTAGQDTSENGIVKIWSDDGELIQSLAAHPRPVLAANYSPDGEWIVTGSEDTTARVWSARTGEQVAVLKGHAAPITSVSFSRDRLRVLTGADDNTAKVWDTAFLATWREDDEKEDKDKVVTLKEITTLSYHTRSVTSAMFSQDGRHILTSGLDGNTVLWLGTQLAPAVRLSGQALECRGESGLHVIDSRAFFSSPSRSDLDQSTLTVSLSLWDDEADRLALLVPEAQSATISVEGDEVFFHQDDDAHLIAHLAGGKTGMPLTITFTAAADRAGVEAVLRCVAYEHSARVVADAIRTVQFRFALADGRSGNFESETQTIHLLAEPALAQQTQR